MICLSDSLIQSREWHFLDLGTGKWDTYKIMSDYLSLPLFFLSMICVINQVLITKGKERPTAGWKASNDGKASFSQGFWAPSHRVDTPNGSWCAFLLEPGHCSASLWTVCSRQPLSCSLCVCMTLLLVFKMYPAIQGILGTLQSNFRLSEDLLFSKILNTLKHPNILEALLQFLAKTMHVSNFCLCQAFSAPDSSYPTAQHCVPHPPVSPSCHSREPQGYKCTTEEDHPEESPSLCTHHNHSHSFHGFVFPPSIAISSPPVSSSRHNPTLLVQVQSLNFFLPTKMFAFPFTLPLYINSITIFTSARLETWSPLQWIDYLKCHSSLSPSSLQYSTLRGAFLWAHFHGVFLTELPACVSPL